jgi:hypothetical protein
MTEYSVDPLGLCDSFSIPDFRKIIAVGRFLSFVRLSFWQKATW